jgi:hypothetical protein
LNWLEVEEQAWIADAIAVQVALKITSKSSELFRNFTHTAAIARILGVLS